MNKILAETVEYLTNQSIRISEILKKAALAAGLVAATAAVAYFVVPYVLTKAPVLFELSKPLFRQVAKDAIFTLFTPNQV